MSLDLDLMLQPTDFEPAIAALTTAGGTIGPQIDREQVAILVGGAEVDLVYGLAEGTVPIDGDWLAHAVVTKGYRDVPSAIIGRCVIWT